MKVIFSYSTPFEKIEIAEIPPKEEEDYPPQFLSEADKVRLSLYSNPVKKLEFIAGRYCASKVTGGTIRFDCHENQPPNVEKGYLSIAHTHGHAAAAYHINKRVGIDIELANRKIPEKVLKRFANEAELRHIKSGYDALKIWCAKEAVYKAGHISGLEFKTNIHIQWKNNDFGCGILNSNSIEIPFALHHFFINNLLIVYAVEV